MPRKHKTVLSFAVCALQNLIQRRWVAWTRTWLNILNSFGIRWTGPSKATTQLPVVQWPSASSDTSVGHISGQPALRFTDFDFQSRHFAMSVCALQTSFDRAGYIREEHKWISNDIKLNDMNEHKELIPNSPTWTWFAAFTNQPLFRGGSWFLNVFSSGHMMGVALPLGPLRWSLLWRSYKKLMVHDAAWWCMGTMGIKIVIFTLGSLGSFGVNPRTQPKGNRNMLEYGGGMWW